MSKTYKKTTILVDTYYTHAEYATMLANRKQAELQDRYEFIRSKEKGAWDSPMRLGKSFNEAIR